MVKYPPPERLGDWLEHDQYLQEIGRFIVEFSRLELMLGGFVIEVAQFRSDHTESLIRTIDFASLCRLAQEIAIKELRTMEEKKVKSVFKRCLQLNTEARVPIVHGTWLKTEDGLGALHFSRNTLSESFKFEKIESISNFADETHSLLVEVTGLMLDYYKEREGAQ